jgi:hypothetical protein
MEQVEVINVLGQRLRVCDDDIATSACRKAYERVRSGDPL